MESEVVTRCISEKLKEKGFNWVCSHYYRIGIKDLFRIFPCEDWSDVRDRINVPTISQALKWLREKNVDIVIRPIFVNGNREYTTEIYAPRYNKPYYIGNVSDWEKAAIIGIKYALNNLI